MRLAEIMKEYYINVEDIRGVYAYGAGAKARRSMITAVQNMVDEARANNLYYPMITEKNEVRSIVLLKNGQIIGTRFTASAFCEKFMLPEEIINETAASAGARKKENRKPQTAQARQKKTYINTLE